MTARAQAEAHAACVLCGASDAGALFDKGGYTFVRCNRCGLVSLRPIPTPAQVKAHHEESYAHGSYATFAAADTIRSAIAAYRVQIVRPLAPPGPWLDIGCSTGAFPAEAVRAGVDAEGLELSSVAAAQGRARGLTIHEGTAEGFAPPHPYAAVTAFDVVEHLPDPLPFVRRVGSWLLPDGVLVMTLPNIASPIVRVMGRHWFYYAPPDHIHYFTPRTIRRLLAEGGFHDVAVRPVSKPLTLDYGGSALEHFNPTLGRMFRAVMALGPSGLRRRVLPLRVGEMVVVARRPAS